MSCIDQHPVENYQVENEDVLESAIHGYKKYQILYAAIEFGLFDYLHENGASNREVISKSLGIKGMFMQSFLQVLIEMGLLRRQDKQYTLTETAERLLCGGEGTSKSAWVKYSGAHHPNWGKLLETFAAGDDALNTPLSSPSAEMIDSLALMSRHSELPAMRDAIMGWPGFASAKSLLDIGGGHGLLAVTLCQQNEGLTAHVMDKPHVGSVIKANQLGHRVTDLGLNVPIETISGQYDIVVCSHYLYKHRKYLEFAFEHVYRLLKSGGLFVANHWFCEIGCGPEQSGISALDKAFLSFGHPLCHVETFPRFFSGAGFSLISESDIPGVYGFSRLHMAVKEETPIAAADAEQKHSRGCCE